MPYVLAGLYCKEQKQDDCLLQNGQGKIIESISSNLFLIKGQTVYTPGIGSGCIDGIMRKQIIAFLPELGFHLIETPGFTVEELLEADEIFLSNSISGIRWVVGYGEKRFFGIKVRKIFKRMMALLTVS
jgi:branched-chain amino acid aminotransferase